MSNLAGPMAELSSSHGVPVPMPGLRQRGWRTPLPLSFSLIFPAVPLVGACAGDSALRLSKKPQGKCWKTYCFQCQKVIYGFVLF